MLNYPISVFLDTNIFIRTKYDFSSNKMLTTLLSYIGKNKINLYISSIVENEVKNHIKMDTSMMLSIFKKSYKESKNIISENTLAINLPNSQWIKDISENDITNKIISNFDDFLKISNAEILDNNIDSCKLMENYFFNVSPFETKKNKKSEFPDAIMSLKLKTLFSETNPVYIISNDEGFRNSFSGYNGFTPLECLKDLFDLITKDTEKDYNSIKSLITDKKFTSIITEKIKQHIENEDFTLDGSFYDYECIEYDETYLDDIGIIKYKFDSITDIIYETDNNLTVKCILLCEVPITVQCSYFDEENSAWDPEEKKYIITRWKLLKEKHNAKFDCNITFNIDKSISDLEIDNLTFELILNRDTCLECVPLNDEYYDDEFPLI